jgi:hypothetical protein
LRPPPLSQLRSAYSLSLSLSPCKAWPQRRCGHRHPPCHHRRHRGSHLMPMPIRPSGKGRHPAARSRPREGPAPPPPVAVAVARVKTTVAMAEPIILRDRLPRRGTVKPQGT